MLDFADNFALQFFYDLDYGPTSEAKRICASICQYVALCRDIIFHH